MFKFNSICCVIFGESPPVFLQFIDWLEIDSNMNIQNDNWNDKNFVIEKMNQDISNTKYVSEELLKDKDVLLLAIKNNYPDISLSKEFRSDKDIVLALMNNNYDYCLSFATKELLNDKDVVLSAVKILNSYFKYASETLQNDREFIFQVLDAEPTVFGFLNRKFQNDKEIVLFALQRNPRTFLSASEMLKQDKHFLLNALKYQKSIYDHLYMYLQEDLEIYLAFHGMLHIQRERISYFQNVYFHFTPTSLESQLDKFKKKGFLKIKLLGRGGGVRTIIQNSPEIFSILKTKEKCLFF